MLHSLYFGNKPVPQPQKQAVPQPVQGQQANPAAPEKPQQEAAAETKPEPAALPIPDFSQEPQRSVCPFKSAVNIEKPAEKPPEEKPVDANAPKQTKQPETRRSGCGTR